MKTTKILYGLIALLVLTGLGFYIYGQKQNQDSIVDSIGPSANSKQSPTIMHTNPSNDSGSPAANSETVAPSSVTVPPGNSTAGNSPAHYSDESDISNDVAVELVTYDGKSFSPAKLTIKAGDIIVFNNQSSSTMSLRGANSHTWTAYPDFDSQEVPIGGNFQFKFTKAGTWQYQDYEYSSAQGTIIVTK